MLLLAREEDNVIVNALVPALTVRWSRNEVEPDHNPLDGIQRDQFHGEEGNDVDFAEHDFVHDANKVFVNDPARFTPPGACLVSPLVTTANVPDDSSAQIQIYHAVTNAIVATIANLTVRGGRVVQPGTGEPPQLSFRAAQNPWREWTAPFFYFRATVTVDDVPVVAETSRDHANAAAHCLRVKYWHACVVDSSATMGSSLRRIATRTAQELRAVSSSFVYVVDFAVGSASTRMAGSALRNTYSAIVCAHGKVKGRHVRGDAPLVNSAWIRDGEDPQKYRSQVDIAFGVLDDRAAANQGVVPSVPRYLLYLSSCFAGWEPSLANAIIARGCQYVIAFKKMIYAPNAEAMATKFYRRWAGTNKLDPTRIPDAFLEASADYRFIMEPVLYEQGRATQPAYASERVGDDLGSVLDYLSEHGRGGVLPLPPAVESLVASLVDFGFFSFRSISNRPGPL